MVLTMEPSTRHILSSPVLDLRMHVCASGDWEVSGEVWDGSDYNRVVEL